MNEFKATPFKKNTTMTLMPMPTGMLQRKCACGNHTLGGECESCGKKNLSLQRKAPNSRLSTQHSDAVPSIVHDVLRSPGQPLDPATRAFFEPHFGHDFSQVRVHTDAKAGESAHAVNALAYTVGRDVVFGEGRYSPNSQIGQRLLAHELTHVAQQARTISLATVSLPSGDGDADREADRVSDRVSAGSSVEPTRIRPSIGLQRKIKVNDPKAMIPTPKGVGLKQTNAKTVQNYLTTLCAAGSVSVDIGKGDVNIGSSFCTRPTAKIFGIEMPWTTASPAEQSKTPTGCGCICDLVSSAHLWTIKVDDSSWPHTLFDDHDAANGITAGGTGGIVTTPSPNSPKLWGASTTSGKALDIDPWLVLGHELCGHGWLGNFGRHGPDVADARGEGGHQATVARENELRKEHGVDLRGTFKDPNCGESYWRDKKVPGTVNWSGYRSVCQAWRVAYNKKNGTSYKITDRIP